MHGEQQGRLLPQNAGDIGKQSITYFQIYSLTTMAMNKRKDTIFSLVVATLQDNGELEEFLASTVNLEGNLIFEVIVVDQNKDNRIAKIVKRFEDKLDIRHIRVNFIGASRARNVGARAAKGDWIGFPDDDCLFFPDTLLQVANLASDETLQVITGKTVDETGTANLLRWKVKKTLFDRWNMFSCLTEATLFIRRDAFLYIKGFDESFGPGASFPAAEGMELMNRLFSAPGNIRACYSPDIKMQHPTKIPPWNKWAARRFYEYAKADGALIAKSLKPNIIYFGGRSAASALLQVLTIRGWRSAAFAARLAGLLCGFTFGIIAFRLKIQGR